MDTITISFLIALIILCNIEIIYGPFRFMEEINIEDGIGMLHPEGFNKLNQYKIFVKNGVYSFYFKNPKYGRYEPQLYRYVFYNHNTNHHRFEEIKSKSIRYSGFVYVEVYGYKNDMKYITYKNDEILKIISTPEYAL